MEYSEATANPSAVGIPLRDLPQRVEGAMESGLTVGVIAPAEDCNPSGAREWLRSFSAQSGDGTKPILLMPRSDASRVSEIAVSLVSDDPDRLQSRLFEQANMIAATLRLPLRLLNIWHLPEKHILRSARVNARDEDIRSRLQHQREVARARIDRLRMDCPQFKTVIDLEGSLQRALAGYLANRAGILTLISHSPQRIFGSARLLPDLHARSMSPLLILPRGGTQPNETT